MHQQPQVEQYKLIPYKSCANNAMDPDEFEEQKIKITKKNTEKKIF